MKKGARGEGSSACLVITVINQSKQSLFKSQSFGVGYGSLKW